MNLLHFKHIKKLTDNLFKQMIFSLLQSIQTLLDSKIKVNYGKPWGPPRIKVWGSKSIVISGGGWVWNLVRHHESFVHKESLGHDFNCYSLYVKNWKPLNARTVERGNARGIVPSSLTIWSCSPLPRWLRKFLNFFYYFRI